MSILDLVFPKSCVGCGHSGGYVCNSCAASFSAAKDKCVECKDYSFAGKTHSHCKTKYSLDGLIVLWQYRGVSRKAIHTIKYKFAFDLAKDIADLALKSEKIRQIPDNSVLIPIPSYKERERWRGFNHSEVIGAYIAKNLKLGFNKKLLFEAKGRVPQVGLSKQKRLQNIRGKFAVKKYSIDKLMGKNIVLFDDVTTTGSTINEAAKTLKKNGVGQVWALVLAG